MLGLPDFYTGEILCEKKALTIEHLIPQGKNTRQRAKKIGLTGVNSLGNLVPVLEKINNLRQDIPLFIWYKMNLPFLDNSMYALKKYEQVDLKPDELFIGSPAINGKEWVTRLKYTLNTELGFPAFTGRKTH